MIYTIKGETPFQVLTDAFSIGPSSEGYTLQVSSDGFNYSDLFSVGPHVTRMVTGVASGSYYRMKNNASEVSVNWIKDCGGGGSGSGAQGPQGPAGSGSGGTGTQGPQGPKGDQGPAGNNGQDGSQGPQGLDGQNGADGAQGPEGKQGPAGGGEGGSNTMLVSVSALPETITWATWADNTFSIARETCTNDGDYLIHWNNDETFTGVAIAGGAITGFGYGGNWSLGEDGKYHATTWGGDFQCWVENGKLYWVNAPSVISQLDAYGIGSDKEGGVADPSITESSVVALQGQQGLYQVVGGEWTPMAGGSGQQGPEGPQGATGAEGPQGPQGPAGGGSGSDEAKALIPVAELPTYLWSEWQDDTYRIARETCTNDGDYLIHWNNNENYTGVACAGGSITGSGYGMLYDSTDGFWHNQNDPDIIAYSSNGKLYWMGLPSNISMLDAYETGSDKEGGVDVENGRVMATSGGTYQMLNDAWTPLVHSEGGVVNIWKGTAAEYAALSPNYDNNTFYIIL